MKKMVESIVCDETDEEKGACNTVADSRCKRCKKDLCYEHSLTLSSKSGNYNIRNKVLGIFCTKCIEEMLPR